MPKHWYNTKAANDSEDPIDKKIVADRKPYFMIYRYPELKSRYNTYNRAARNKCAVEFGIGIDDLLSLDRHDDEQADFLHYYDALCPVQHSNGVINRICKMCEDYFDHRKEISSSAPKFDWTIMKSGAEYSRYAKDCVTSLYHEYMARLQELGQEDEENAAATILREEFLKSCALVCPSEEELCNIVLDICYTKEKSKRFAWDMCGDQIVRNLLEQNNGTYYFPMKNTRGDITYGGKRFVLESAVREDGLSERDCTE